MSIEFVGIDPERFAQLVIVECKATARPVEIGDAREFHARLQEIGEDNTKGVLAATAGFTSTTLEFARTHGIMLVRFHKADDVEIILDRRQAAGNDYGSAFNTARLAILGGPLASRHPVAATFDGNFFFPRPADILAYLGLSDGRHRNNAIAVEVPFLSDDDIESEVERLFGDLEVDPRRDWSRESFSGVVTSAQRSGVISAIARRDLGVDARGRQVLGCVNPANGEITVHDGIDTDDPRSRFTVAHEIGHLVLHRELVVQLAAQHFEVDQDRVRTPSTDDLAGLPALEWQANRFAGAVLMPRQAATAEVMAVVEKHRIDRFTSAPLYVDLQSHNIRPYLDLMSAMKAKFGVSQQAATIRLARLGLIKDERFVDRPQHVQKLIRR